jgi:hypothetical protein
MKRPSFGAACFTCSLFDIHDCGAELAFDDKSLGSYYEGKSDIWQPHRPLGDSAVHFYLCRGIPVLYVGLEVGNKEERFLAERDDLLPDISCPYRSLLWQRLDITQSPESIAC